MSQPEIDLALPTLSLRVPAPIPIQLPTPAELAAQEEAREAAYAVALANPRMHAAAAAAKELHASYKGFEPLSSTYPYPSYPFYPGWYDYNGSAPPCRDPRITPIIEAASQAWTECDKAIWKAENRTACPSCEREEGKCDCIARLNNQCTTCGESECNCIIWCANCKWHKKYPRPYESCQCKDLAEQGRLWITLLEQYQSEWPQPHEIPCICLDKEGRPYIRRNGVGEPILDKDGNMQILQKTRTLTGGFYNGEEGYIYRVADSLVGWCPSNVDHDTWEKSISQCSLYQKQRTEQMNE